MQRYIRWSLVVAAILVFAAIGCSDDGSPVAPVTTGSVSGTVVFEGTWPAIGEIQVSVYSGLTPPYIPMGPPDGATDPVAPANQFDYKIAGLDKGSYSAIFVSWRDPLNPSGAKLLGMYWTFPDSVGIALNGLPVAPPTGFEVDNSYPQFKNYNLTADLDKAN